VFGDLLHLTVADPARAIPAIRAALEDAGVAVGSIDVAAPSLEDVFISLMSTPERAAHA
jgi:hypothetical protein